MTPTDLRAFRQQHDLTQDELAYLLCVHPRTIRRWERGERGIPHWVPGWLRTFKRSELNGARIIAIARTSKRRGARA